MQLPSRQSLLAFLARHLERLVIGCVVAWPLLTLGIVFGEREVMYWPQRWHMQTPLAAGLKGVSESELITPDGHRLVVWSTPPKPGAPTILYFHGNGEPLAFRALRIARFQNEGWGVFMFAYRGFDRSSGAPSEAAIIADARLAYDSLKAQGLAARDIVLFGESLGANVALQVAMSRDALCIVLDAPFTSMVETWKQFAWFLPVESLLKDRYDSLRIVGRLRLPLLVLHGAKDPLIGVRLGRTLYAAAPEPKRLVVFANGHHTDLLRLGGVEEIRRFLAELREQK